MLVRKSGTFEVFAILQNTAQLCDIVMRNTASHTQPPQFM